MSELSLAIRKTLAREGIELPKAVTAKMHAIEAAFAVLAADLERGKLDLDRYIDIEDETGKILYTVRFRDLIDGKEMAN